MSFWLNNPVHVLEEIILIEMMIEVPIMIGEACIILSMGVS